MPPIDILLRRFYFHSVDTSSVHVYCLLGVLRYYFISSLLAACLINELTGLAIRRFFQRRSTFAIHLSDCNSGFSPSLYIRLLGMCITQILWTIATVAYSFWFTITSGPLRNWTNWADVHKEWMFVGQYPSTPTFARMYNGSYVLWWTIPVSTFIYISFFVCGRAAIDEYRQTFMAVKERFVTLTPLRYVHQGYSCICG